MDGHQRHLVVVPIVLIGVSEEGHVHQEVAHGSDGVGVGRIDLVREFLHAGQQLFHVFIPGHAFGRFVLVKLAEQAGVLGDVVTEVKGVGRVEPGGKPLDHRGEVLKLAPSGSLEVLGFPEWILKHLPQGTFVMGRRHGEPVHRGLANAPCRVVDHPLEAFVVGGIGREPEVGDQVLDLLALVETESAIDAVGDVALSQLLLEGPGLGIGAIEDGKVEVLGLFPRARGQDRVCDVAAFVIVAQRAVHIDFVSFIIAGPDFLLNLVLVFGDDGVGRFHDGLRAAVVLLEFVDDTVGVVPLEVEDVLDVGAPKAVDALRIVAHHAHIFPGCAELADDEVLGEVGVLVLVDQDEGKLLLVLVEQVGEVAEQDVGLEQEVVEVHGAGALQPQVVPCVDLGDSRAARLLVLPHDVGVGCIILWADEVVLRPGNAPVDGIGFVEFVVQAQRLDDVLDDAPAVLGVVNGEVGRVIDPVRFDAQDAGKDGVEGAHPDVARLGLAHNLADAPLHLARGLVGEGQGENGEGVDPLVDQVGDAVGEHSGLSGPRAGHHHHGALNVPCRRPLSVIQSRQHLHDSKSSRIGSAPSRCSPRRAVESSAHFDVGIPVISRSFAPPLKNGAGLELSLNVRKRRR